MDDFFFLTLLTLIIADGFWMVKQSFISILGGGWTAL